MGVQSPAVPSALTDGSVLHASTLNAMSANLTNLWAAVNSGFQTQRPMCIAQQTTSQSIPGSTDTLINFQQAAPNVGNMWTASTPNKISIVSAGIYWLFSQVRWPTVSGVNQGSVFVSNILVNGTSPSNAVSTNLCLGILPASASAGPSIQCGFLAILSAGSTVYLDVWQNCGTQSTQVNFGGSYLGAVWLSPSS